jgi:hypothetical protein
MAMGIVSTESPAPAGAPARARRASARGCPSNPTALNSTSGVDAPGAVACAHAKGAGSFSSELHSKSSVSVTCRDGGFRPGRISQHTK